MQIPEESYFSHPKIYFEKGNATNHDQTLKNLHERIEETCQSEFDQNTADIIPTNNNQCTDERNNLNSCSIIHHQDFKFGQLQNISIEEQNNYNTLPLENPRESFYISGFIDQVIEENKLEDIVSKQIQESPSSQSQNIFENSSKLQLRSSHLINEIYFLSKIKRQIMKFFQTKTQLGKNLYLNKNKIRELVNDRCDIPNQDEFITSKICNRIAHYLQYLYQRINISIPLLSPFNSIKFSLDILFSFINCCFFIFSSILIVFQVTLPQEKQLYTVIYIVWIIQIIIKLNTSIYIKTNLIKNRKIIIRYYLQKYALWDFLPFLLELVSPQYTRARVVFKIIQFSKLKNVISKLNDIQITMCMLYQNYFIIQLIKLILKLFIVGHIIACLWYLVGVIELEYLGEERTWFDEGISIDRNWWRIYIHSIYWSLTLMTTGSNTAETILQISFTSFILLFTTIIFGYLLNIIGIILSEIDQEEENQRRDINQINKYMRKRCISKQTILKIIMGLQIQFKQNKRGLSRAINLDLEYYYLHNFKKDEEQNQIALSKISNNLYEDLKKEYFGRFLNKITFLSEKFSKQTLQKLVLCIDEQNYLPGQIISNNNEQGKENQLIYIIEGKVELIKNCFSNSEGQFAISVIGKDKIIGQIPFFEGRSNDITIKSTDFTQILVISREKFLEIVQQNEQDYQLFCRIKDYIGLYSNYEDLGIKCEICNKFTHNFNDCPLVHIDKADVNIKINFQQSLLQKRSAWKRKDYDYINTLLNQNNVQDKFQLFNMNNNVEQFFVTSPYLKSQSDVPQEYDLSEKDLEMKVTVNTNHARTYTHIRTNEDEEAKLYVQEKVKNQIKRQKMKRGSQQLCINLDSQLSSALEDTLQSSNSSNKEKHQKETSTGIINQDNQNSKSIIQTQNHSSHNQQQLAKFFTNNFSISQRNNKFELTLKKLLLDLFAIIQREEATALQQNQQINNNCIIWEFDQRRDYTIYFPKGNSDRIIRAYNFKSRQNLNRLKRKKQLNK